MFDYIRAIKDFLGYIHYAKEGTIIPLKVKAHNSSKVIYEETTNCVFSYDVGYQQYSIDIDWNVTDTVMRNLGLHASYNTNFQRFRYEDNTLYIDADNITIIVAGE